MVWRPKAPRAKPRDIEHQHQCALVRYVEAQYPGLAAVMTAVPHGGARHKATAGKLKAEGVRAGYPDLLFDLPRGGFHGLRIEMKAPKGRTSPSQDAWHAKLRRAGYCVEVCRGIDEGRAAVDAYMRLPLNGPGSE
jgi:hypothetical protein